MFHLLKNIGKSKEESINGSIPNNSFATIYNEDVEDELKAKDLIHYVSRKVCSSSELVFVVYENERWHPVLKSWGSVGGVHLSGIFDRQHLTDETGHHVFSGNLSEMRPLTGYKWKDSSDWTVIVDIHNTDYQGFQYATNWHLLHEECNPWTSENTLALVRRRQWRRSMVVDTSVPVRTLPYELCLKIKRADIHVSGATSHCYVETYLDGKLWDTTLSSTPDWNKAVSISLMYLKPNLTLSFLLYMRRTLPPLLAKLNVLSNISPASISASGDSYCIGAVHVDLSVFIPTMNQSARDVTYELLARETGKTSAHLVVSNELKETPLFNIISAQSAAFKQLRSVAQDTLCDDFKERISILDNKRMSLLNNVTKLLIENSSMLTESDLCKIVDDLVLFVVCRDNRSVLFKEDNQQNVIESVREAVRKMNALSQTLCYYPRVAFTGSSEVSFNDANCDAKNLRQVNYDTFIRTQPVCSSVYDANLSGGFPFRSTSSSGYQVTVITHDGVEHTLAFSVRRDLVLFLKALSHAKYSQVYEYVTSGQSEVDVFASSAAVKYIRKDSQAEVMSTAVAARLTVDCRDSSECILIERVSNNVADIDGHWLIPFEDIVHVTLSSVPTLPKLRLVELTLHSACSSHPALSSGDCRIDIDSTDGMTHLHTPAPTPVNRHLDTIRDINTLYFKDTVFRFLVSEFESSVIVTLNTNEVTIPGNKNNKQRPIQIPAVCNRLHLTLPSTLSDTYASTTTECVSSSLCFSTNRSTYTIQFTVQRMENLMAVDGSGTSDPYFIVYLADAQGSIIPLNSNGNRHSNTTSSSSIVIPGFKSITKTVKSVATTAAASLSSLSGIEDQCVYRSRVVSKTVHPVFNELITISSDKYDSAAMSRARFVYVEIFDRNTTRSDVPLGEVYLPILPAVIDGEKQHEMPRVNVYPVQPSKSMMLSGSYKYLSRSAVESSLGTVYAELTVLNKPVVDMTDGEDLIVLRTSTVSKPLQTADCFWPAYVLKDKTKSSAAVAGLTNVTPHEAYNVYIGKQGLQIQSGRMTKRAAGGTPPLLSEFDKMLSECKEFQGMEDSTGVFSLLVPYEQINLSSLSILTPECVYCAVKLRRKLGDEKKNSVAVERIVEVVFVIAPCMAENFFVSLTNQIAMSRHRSNLSTLLSSNGSCDQFNTVSVQLQTDLYAVEGDIHTVSRHMQHAVLESKVSSGGGGSTESSDKSGALFNHLNLTHRDSNKLCGYGDFLLLRILTLRKAATQLYFWFAFDQVSTINAQLATKPTRYTMEYIDDLTRKLDAYLNNGDKKGIKSAVDRDASLVVKVTSSMEDLNRHVRDCVLENVSIRSTSNKDLRKLLTKLVYGQYLVIVNYVTHVLVDEECSALVPPPRRSIASEEAKEKMTQQETAAANAKIQRKRDLISFIVTQDNLFITSLEATLQAFGFRFDVRPLLSIVVDFNDLIDRFSALLEDNIQMWNNKTLSHFLTHRGETDDDSKSNGTANGVKGSAKDSAIPWDVTTLMGQIDVSYSSSNNDVAEYYISYIPETIQTQLNIQIGLKRIPLNGDSTSAAGLSLQSIRRIYAINMQISQAVARAYVTLAVEYDQHISRLAGDKASSATEKAMGRRRIGLLRMSHGLLRNIGSNIHSNIHQTVTSVANAGVQLVSAESVKSPNRTESRDAEGESGREGDGDELLSWFMACVNDVYRITHNHIPDTIAAFTADYSEEEDGLDDDQHSTSAMTGPARVNKVSRKQEVIDVYNTSLRAMDCVAKHATNCMANQLLLGADLRTYFLSEFDKYLLSAGTDSKDGHHFHPFSLPLPLLNLVTDVIGNLSPLTPSGSDVNNTETTSAVSYSPMEVVCATLKAFYGYATLHMYPAAVNRLIYSCLKKIALRYLICLRDVTARLEATHEAKQTRHAVSQLIFKNPLVEGTTTVITTGISGINTGISGVAGGINSGITGMADLSRQLTAKVMPRGSVNDESLSTDASNIFTANNEVNKEGATTTELVTVEDSTSDFFDHPYLSDRQCALIREDLAVLSATHLHVQSDKAVALLRFMNTEIANILCGTENTIKSQTDSDSNKNSSSWGMAGDVDRLIQSQFSLKPPVYRTSYMHSGADTQRYEREVEDCVSLSAAFSDRLPREIADYNNYPSCNSC